MGFLQYLWVFDYASGIYAGINGPAITGDVTILGLGNITTEGLGAYGIDSNVSFGNATIMTGDIATKSEQAYGISSWVPDGNSTITSGDITTQGDDAYQLHGSSAHYRSHHQSSASFATQNFGTHWVSLSGSDAAAGIGRSKSMGENSYCFGDAFDLFVHYEHKGNFTAALRAYAVGQLIYPS